MMNSSINSEATPIRIGIHSRENSFSERWIAYCKNNNISYKTIDCHSLNVIEEIKNEIFQLENNIQFFTNTRNAKKENSIVLEVRKNIEKNKEEMEILKDKLKQVKNLNQA